MWELESWGKWFVLAKLRPTGSFQKRDKRQITAGGGGEENISGLEEMTGCLKSLVSSVNRPLCDPPEAHKMSAT